MATKELTVGELRKALEGVRDNKIVFFATRGYTFPAEAFSGCHDDTRAFVLER